MNAPQLFYPGQATAFNKIIKRPMTDSERMFAVVSYKMLQNGLRAIAVVSLVLYIMYTFVLVDTFTDETMSMVFSILMLVFGLMALGMSANTLVMRKKTSDAMREGMAIEVQGPAYRSRAMKNVQSWTIGPISLMATRETDALIQEGAQVSVLCIPKLKAALAINNVGLRRGTRAMFPPNLEAMAVMAEGVAMPPAGQPYQNPYPGYGAPMPQAQPAQTAYSQEELPPPPPPDF